MPKHGVHTTPNAEQYYGTRCVSRLMSTMADPVLCIAHMAGISEGNPQMASKTIADLRAHCAAKEQSFTVGDAEELCASLGDAHREFWEEHHAEDHGPREGPSEATKIKMFGTSWCSFTKMEEAALAASGHEDRFTVIKCDETPEYEGCRNIESFPTFYNCTPGDDGCTPCFTGFSENVAGIVDACSA
jgi:hypothetical protein